MGSSVKNKVVWVVGASSGIGEALAYELARRGASVVLSARRSEIIQNIVERIRSQDHRASAFAVDVLDLDALKHAASSIETTIGSIDIVIANAGSHIETWPERQFNSAEYMDLMKLNYGGLLHTVEAVLPKMLGRKSGTIVGVASLAGYRGLPKAGAYSASKGAMINFLDSIRFHLSKRGIAVITVNPGFVKTPLTDKNDFYMPFLIDADKAARIIVNGIEREKREIAFPFPFNLVLKVGRILPYRLYAWLVDFMW